MNVFEWYSWYRHARSFNKSRRASREFATRKMHRIHRS